MEQKGSCYGLRFSFMMACAIALSLLLAFGGGVLVPGDDAASLGVGKAYAASELKAASAFKPKLNKKSAKLKYGSTVKLKVSGAKNKKVTWSTSNSKIAKITKKTKTTATIKAVGSGKATITAKVGGKKLKCTITANAKLSSTKVKITALQTKKLSLKGAKAKKWTSSKTSIAKVNSSGTVTPNGLPGTTKITCTDTKGKKYTCSVTVTMPKIKCTMQKTLYEQVGYDYYYYKRFVLYNNTNSKIILKQKVMVYYPFGSTSTSEVLFGMYDTNTFQTLDSSHALYCNAGDSGGFYAFEGDSYYSIYSYGIFGMYLTIGGKDYLCLFSTGGTLGSCSRA